jgi:uncharacterized protein (TIGR01777 family)
MKIVIAGGTGSLGQHLVNRLQKEHKLVILTRSDSQKISENISLVNYSKDINTWSEALRDSDVIINLVGESIARKRWSKKQKEIILDSRLNSIQRISQSLKLIDHTPRLIMNASAVGYYKNSSNIMDEDSSAGEDFLSDVCVRWEDEASDKFRNKTSQLILLRIGVVLDSNSGMLSKLIIPFKLYLGAIIGSGRQYVPWIHINDVTGIICYLMNSEIKGPINLVSPKIDNNLDFSKKLARVLKRVVFLRVPNFMIKIFFGEMSTILIKNSNITPKVILNSEYRFEFENLDDALNDLLS